MLYLRRALLAFAITLSLGSAARAVEYEGVQVPDTQPVNGETLHLNGYGMRTYSFLQFRIYVAALYLQQVTADPEAILRSPQTKLINVTFLRDIGVDDARRSWSDGLENNCRPPCRLDPADLQSFLAAVPAMRGGDRFSLLFTASGANITMNGRPIGTIAHVAFATAVLATFLGPNPASPSLKQELLTGGPKQ
jgi:hypothetical protein